ncbi:sigma factor-like helix-turn-helix DNA-binding protein [Curtobacterium aetherium]
MQLAYYGGFSHSEMAERLGVPIGTVKTRSP